jgi:predicted ATPase/DNA-binding winged helix-turn-helix (wHTH) protein
METAQSVARIARPGSSGRLLSFQHKDQMLLMPETDNHEAAELVSFGPFTLDRAARLLHKDEMPIDLGSRAFDILCVLVDRAGQVVTKGELLATVWEDVSVDESTLRFQVSTLRKALGDGGPDARYLQTLAGRGYCFVAPVSRATPPPLPSAQVTARCNPKIPNGTPPQLARMVGRDEAVERISRLLLDSRFVTVTGSGGIGKTSVAVAVLHKIAGELGGLACFIDLGSLTNPGLVSTALSTALGLAVQSEDPTAEVITFLQDKQILLLLDCCEPVIETAATLAECLFQEVPGVHLLATSREALRAEGENVIALSPLDSPPQEAELSLGEVLKFASAQLFTERAVSSGWLSGFGDEDAPVVAEICRKLDGIPLAIELAAGVVKVYGLTGIAALLKDRFEILSQGRRTALPRHQTLAATLDWSYELLSPVERSVFRQLSVFVGTFTLDAVRSIVMTEDGDLPEVILARLVAKSLVAVKAGRQIARYPLLDTTRAYAARKLADSGEAEAVARRHAHFFAGFLQQLDFDFERSSDAFAAHGEHLGNVRAALDWAFSGAGDLQLGTALAAAAAPFYLELSLLTECRHWCRQAIISLDAGVQGGIVEIDLQAALGLTVMFTESNSDEARIALERGLALAEELGDLPRQFRLVGRLHLFHYRTGDFRTALGFAQRSEVIAEQMADPVAVAAAHSLLGISHHFMEDLKTAYKHLNAAMVLLPPSRNINGLYFGVDYRNRAGICMARTLWVLGCPDQAAHAARQMVDEAESLDHPLSLCIALIMAVTVFLWIGNWQAAESYLTRLVEHARSRSIIPYPSAGIGVQGYLMIMRGNAEEGIPLIRSALRDMYRHRYHLITTALYSAMAEGLLTLGARDQALETIETAFSVVQQHGDLFNMPELLRIKGDILASGAQSDPSQAEGCYRHSLELASRHSALSWELRTAISLARLWAGQGRVNEAVQVVKPVLAQFTEGFGTPDYQQAEHLINELTGSETN